MHRHRRKIFQGPPLVEYPQEREEKEDEPGKQKTATPGKRENATFFLTNISDCVILSVVGR